MTHLQILSNSTNKYGGTNYTNLFTMKLPIPIDGENENKYIQVLSVNYPKTTKNIYDDRCFFYFRIYFLNFFNKGVIATKGITNTNSPAQVTYHSPIHTIPQGLYDLQDIIGYFNSYCSEYDIELKQLSNKRVVLCVGFTSRYKYFQKAKTTSVGTGKTYDGQKINEWHYGDVTQTSDATNEYPANGIVGGAIVEVYFSKKLNFMLGNFKNAIKKELQFSDGIKTIYGVQCFSMKTDGLDFDLNNTGINFVKDKEVEIVETTYLPDQYDGLNKIFIYCEQVQKSIVGNVEANLLAVVPLHYKDQGAADLVHYIPPLVSRKLIKKKIDKLEISLRDSQSELIHFDSGSVNIECIIH